MTINRTTQPEGERMARFTPGPWRLYEHERLFQAQRDAGPELYAVLEEVRGWVWGEERRAKIDAVLTKARGGKA